LLSVGKIANRKHYQSLTVQARGLNNIKGLGGTATGSGAVTVITIYLSLTHIGTSDILSKEHRNIPLKLMTLTR